MYKESRYREITAFLVEPGFEGWEDGPRSGEESGGGFTPFALQIGGWAKINVRTRMWLDSPSSSLREQLAKRGWEDGPGLGDRWEDGPRLLTLKGVKDLGLSSNPSNPGSWLDLGLSSYPIHPGSKPSHISHLTSHISPPTNHSNPVLFYD